MRIDDTVALVASGRYGHGLTHPLDCNVYAIRSRGRCALIDAGAGLAHGLVDERLRASGIDPATVTDVLLTHAHADHSGGSGHWARRGAKVWAPGRALAWLQTRDEAAVSLDRARAAGGYPADYRWDPAEPAATVGDGDGVSIGDLELRVVELPGHSADQVGYLLRTDRLLLFAGDALFTDGRISLLSTYDCDLQAYVRSIARIAALELDALMPGHWSFAWSGAQDIAAATLAQISALRIPPNGP